MECLEFLMKLAMNIIQQEKLVHWNGWRLKVCGNKKKIVQYCLHKCEFKLMFSLSVKNDILRNQMFGLGLWLLLKFSLDVNPIQHSIWFDLQLNFSLPIWHWWTMYRMKHHHYWDHYLEIGKTFFFLNLEKVKIFSFSWF